MASLGPASCQGARGEPGIRFADCLYTETDIDAPDLRPIA